MGRQITYYMELESYKLLVEKAFRLGFKAIERQNSVRICERFDEVTFLHYGMYFHLQEVGQLIVKENGYINTSSSPLIESSFSYINEKKKEVSSARLWVSNGFWSNEDGFIHREEVLDRKYSSLVRYVKKLAPYTEVEVKAQNPMYDGRKFIEKIYITPFLLKKVNSGEYDCI
jgi:hypothetical protein